MTAYRRTERRNSCEYHGLVLFVQHDQRGSPRVAIFTSYGGNNMSESNPNPIADEAPSSAIGAMPVAETKSVTLGVRLTPVDNSDQPVFANYTSVHATPGVAFLDFAFIEPSVLAALPRVEKVPETINGKLTVRVALTQDAVQSLAAQLNQLMRAPRKPGG
jgi:hypothetical protein